MREGGSVRGNETATTVCLGEGEGGLVRPPQPLSQYSPTLLLSMIARIKIGILAEVLGTKGSRPARVFGLMCLLNRCQHRVGGARPRSPGYGSTRVLEYTQCHASCRVPKVTLTARLSVVNVVLEAIYRLIS